MTLYEKNIMTLTEYYPGMDQLIEDARANAEFDLEIMEEQSMDGVQIHKIKKKNTVCYLGGKRNATEPVKIWIETLGKLAPNAPVFIMGVGNARYLSSLVEEAENRITIIVYEPSLQIFLKFLETEDLTGWMKKHLIIFVIDGLSGMGRERIPFLTGKLLSFSKLSYSRYMVLPNYEVLFPEQSVEFLKLCKKSAVDGIILRNTNKQFSTVLVKNLFANASHLCDGYKTTQLVDAVPADALGIVVAAGPSLNKNIRELKKAQGKSFMVAVDTAVKPLLREGIRPDMIMLIDGKKPLKLFEADGIHDIPLVSNLDAASEVLNYHKGKKFFFSQGYQFAEMIFRKSKEPSGTVPSGGSVATSAFALMIKLGLRRIILVGQDLAYTNNRSHADGTFQETMNEINTSGMMTVEGNFEEKIPTRADFKQYLDWYEDTIKQMKKKDPEFHVMNATEGGAKIANTEIVTLREAIDRECTKETDIAENIRKLKPMLDQEQRQWAVNYLKDTPEKCREFTDNAFKIRNLYKKLGKICDKSNLDRKEYLGILKKIEKEVSLIEKGSIYQLAASTLTEAQYAIQSEEYLHEKSVAAEGKEISRKGILLMNMMIECGQIFEKYAEEVFQDLK